MHIKIDWRRFWLFMTFQIGAAIAIVIVESLVGLNIHLAGGFVAGIAFGILGHFLVGGSLVTKNRR